MNGWYVCKFCPENLQFEMNWEAYRMHFASMHRDRPAEDWPTREEPKE